MTPHGAATSVTEISNLLKNRVHLVAKTGPPDDEWAVISAEFTLESWGDDRSIIKAKNLLSNGGGYFFFNDNGKFPWSGVSSYLFENYWFAFAYCQQLNAKP